MAVVAVLATNLVAGVGGPVPFAQVRPLVLEDPSHAVPPEPPPRLPPRRATLSRQWEIEAGGQIVDGFLGGPGGVVFATHDGTVRLSSPDSGQAIWVRRLAAPVEFAPAGINRRVYIVAGHQLFALAAETGELVWTTELPGEPAWAPVADNQRVVVSLTSGEIVIIDAGAGIPRGTASPGCLASAPPRIQRNRIAIACREGAVLLLDPDSGETVWRRKTRAAVRTAPFIGKKSVLVADDSRRLLALGLRHGRPRYAAHLAARPGPFLIVRQGTVLVGAFDNMLYAFRGAGGHMLWSADIGARPASPPAVRGDMVVSIPMLSTSIVVVDLRDGAVIGDEPLADPDRHSAGGPVFAGRILVVASRPVGGGPGWLTGYTVEVEEVARGVASAAARGPSR
ncbi:MAG: PQQ-binding-like beta-propeller repeat protein [Acidobacteriota bacterium]